MSVNMNAAVPASYRKKEYGKNYYTIDFDMSDTLTERAYEKQWEKGAVRPVVGTLEIGTSKVPVTLKELEKLRATVNEAIGVTEMSYRLGRLR